MSPPGLSAKEGLAWLATHTKRRYDGSYDLRNLNRDLKSRIMAVGSGKLNMESINALIEDEARVSEKKQEEADVLAARFLEHSVAMAEDMKRGVFQDFSFNEDAIFNGVPGLKEFLRSSAGREAFAQKLIEKYANLPKDVKELLFPLYSIFQQGEYGPHLPIHTMFFNGGLNAALDGLRKYEEALVVDILGNESHGGSKNHGGKKKSTIKNKTQKRSQKKKNGRSVNKSRKSKSKSRKSKSLRK